MKRGKEEISLKVTMAAINPYSEKCRVFLLGVGRNTAEEAESFCHRLSERFNIPQPLLRKIVDLCPIVVKKNLTRTMAESLARTLKSFGAQVSVEVKKDLPPLSLEFQNLGPHQLAIESSSFGRTSSGIWNVFGRVKNVAPQSLSDIWVLIQVFDAHEEFLTFEEVPLTLNPLPPEAVSPYKAVFERDLPLHKVSIAFKTSSGSPVAAIDRRPIPQWTILEQDEGDEAVLSIDLSRPTRPVQVQMPPEELRKEALALPPLDLKPSKGETPPQAEEPLEETEKNVDISLEEALACQGEPSLLQQMEPPPSHLASLTEDRASISFAVEAEGESKEPEEVERAQESALSIGVSIPLLEKRKENGASEEGVEEASERESVRERPLVSAEPVQLDVSAFEEASRVIHGISEDTEKKDKEPSLFPWMERFRNRVQRYYEEYPDPFLQWFKTRQSGNEFQDDFHSILVLLAHARFDQINETEKALKNTECVFQQLAKPQVGLDEIPTLEGSLFFSKEQWRELFYRAIPKLRQIGRSIIDKKKGEAFEIQRMILVIPHMSEKMSRKALWWISVLMPHAMAIDFSNHPVLIDGPLYRVASRLGIVDPHFDVYQGRSSMGDLKIQAFSKSAFPREPFKIESPMAWTGRDEAGGHCLPSQPRCEGCLFEEFCQKLYLHFDPSEKGMGRH